MSIPPTYGDLGDGLHHPAADTIQLRLSDAELTDSCEADGNDANALEN